MQQFCTYGSVRGASGQPASLPRQKGLRGTLPHGRGSVSYCKHVSALLSRARKQAILRVFQQPVSTTGS